MRTTRFSNSFSASTRGDSRIVPALLVCLLVTTAATILFIPSSWLRGATQKTGLYAFFGMSNFALLSSGFLFSPRPAYNPFTHTWSLAVEEQFYLFYPLILFVSLPPRPQRRTHGNIGQSPGVGALPLFVCRSVVGQRHQS